MGKYLGDAPLGGPGRPGQGLLVQAPDEAGERIVFLAQPDDGRVREFGGRQGKPFLY
jgi:hypothetical protein